jgi:hypothetical protein
MYAIEKKKVPQKIDVHQVGIGLLSSRMPSYS